MTPRVSAATLIAVVGARSRCAPRPAPSSSGRPSQPPRPLAARPVDFPPYQIKTLPNGLQVLVVLHHEQPSVSFRLLVRAGAMQEPADKPASRASWPALLNQGTTTKSAGEIANLIESAGGIIGVGSGNELTLRQRRRHQGSDRSDARPRVRHGPATRVRAGGDRAAAQPGRSRRSRSSYDDPDYLANLVFDRLVFGFHPYGRPNEGHARVDRADHARRSGRVSPHVVRAEQRAARDRRRPDGRRGVCGRGAAFGTLGSGATCRPSKTIEPPRRRGRIVVIDRPGSAQTEIRVGHLAVPRTHPDFVPARSRRSASSAARARTGCSACCVRDRGLTYGASADVQHLQEQRRHRRRDRHAIVRHRRVAAADGGRVRPAAAGAGAVPRSSAARRTFWPATFR